MAGQTVTCERYDVDRYGRMIAVCKVGDVDVAAEQVREGLALAYRRFSKAYVGFERNARDARRGAWAGEFDPPWEWRERERKR